MLNGRDDSMSKNHPLAARLGTLLLIASLGPPLGSQPPPPAPAAPPTEFREVVEVNVVNLTVRVTDKEGHSVKGLGRGDFEILEDGKPVEIANFYEVRSPTD